jgi:hypothetical protein
MMRLARWHRAVGTYADALEAQGADEVTMDTYRVVFEGDVVVVTEQPRSWGRRGIRPL